VELVIVIIVINMEDIVAKAIIIRLIVKNLKLINMGVKMIWEAMMILTGKRYKKENKSKIRRKKKNRLNKK